MNIIEYDDIQLQWTSIPQLFHAEIEREVRSEIRKNKIKASQMQIGHFMAAHGFVIYICGQDESEIYYCTIFL